MPFVHFPVPAPSRPSRLLRLAPLLVAVCLAFLTTSARQWEALCGNLSPRGMHARQRGVYRFAPSGNEWRFRKWSAFGADRIELRRTFTVDDSVDPIADAHATFPDTLVSRSLVAKPPAGQVGLRWSAQRWGWPMRHTQSDQLGYRAHLPLGFVVDSLVYTPVWLLIIHLVRVPVAAINNHFRIPEWACRKCRYDLRGLADDAPCPECGRKRPADSSPA